MSRRFLSFALAIVLVSGCSTAPLEDSGGDSNGVGATSGDGDGDVDPGVGGDYVPGAGGAGVATGGNSGDGDGAGGTAPTSPSTVVVVAHQDDDLLFINPELKHALDRNEKLTTIYLTSGNAGMGMDYVLEREMGIRAAYAFMAGGANHWACGPSTIANKTIESCVYGGAKDLQLVFFRLVDGWADGSATGSLESLWKSNTESSAAVDGSGLSFSRVELLATLVEIFERRGATDVMTTDFSYRDPEQDHSDHEYAAFFTVASSSVYPWPHGLHSHVTYGTQNAPSNLSAQDTAIVADTFSFYASCDKELPGCAGGASCDQMTCSTSSTLYQSWTSRYYVDSRRTPPLTGALNSGAGSCLGATGAIVACESAAPLDYQSDFRLTRTDGQCLTASALGSSKELHFMPCVDLPHQKWFVMEGGQVVSGATPAQGNDGGYDRSQCLSAGGGIGAAARVDDCGNGVHLEWSF